MTMARGQGSGYWKHPREHHENAKRGSRRFKAQPRGGDPSRFKDSNYPRFISRAPGGAKVEGLLSDSEAYYLANLVDMQDMGAEEMDEEKYPGAEALAKKLYEGKGELTKDDLDWLSNLVEMEEIADDMAAMPPKGTTFAKIQRKLTSKRRRS